MTTASRVATLDSSPRSPKSRRPTRSTRRSPRATARNEGLVLKDPESIYSPGRRGQAWLKLKTHLPTLDCVVTAAEYGHGKRRNSLSDYTFAVWDREPAEPDATAGQHRQGVQRRHRRGDRAAHGAISRSSTAQQYGRVHLVEPKVVLEIACDQIQQSDPPRQRVRAALPADQADPVGQERRRMRIDCRA